MTENATYLLLYTYVADMADRRGPYRDAHLERIRAEREAGRVILAGALGIRPAAEPSSLRTSRARTLSASRRPTPMSRLAW